MRFRCQDCDYVCDEKDVLTAPNPFAPQYVVCGCPRCLEVGTMLGACDEPGCMAYSSCGTSTDGGYRVTCSRHAPWAKGEKP